MHILKFKFEVNSVQRSSDFHYIQCACSRANGGTITTKVKKQEPILMHPHPVCKCSEFRDGTGLKIGNSIFCPCFYVSSINEYDRPSLNLI